MKEEVIERESMSPDNQPLLLKKGLIKKVVAISFTLLMVFAAFQAIMPTAFAQTDKLRILNYGALEQIDSANPYVGIYDISYVYFGMIYDYLISPDENLQPQPNLAATWWYMDGPTAASLGHNFDTFATHSDPNDWPLGSIWEYNLTENVFWNDGTPFTAYDVEWTINIQIGDNFMAYWAYQPYTRWIDHAEAIDDYKVRIFFSDLDTKTPFPATFGYNLFIPMMPKHIFEGLSPTHLAFVWDGVPAIGTGPFMGTANLRKELISKEIVTLIQNPYYNFIDPVDGIRKGLGGAYDRESEIDRLVFTFFSEEATLYVAIRTGSMDTAEIPATDYLQLLGDPTKPEALHLVSMLSPTAYSKQVVINPKSDAPGTLSPLRMDPAVHRAASLATNKSFIIKQVYKELGELGYGLISPIWPKWYWEPSDELSWFNLTDGNGDIIPEGSYSKPIKDVMSYDFDLANQILTAAGYVWTGTPGASTRKATLLVGERLQQMGLIQDPNTVVNEELDFEMVIDNAEFDDKLAGDYLMSAWGKIGIKITEALVDSPTWNKLIYSYTYNTMITYWSGDIDPNYLCFIPTSYALFGWNEFGTAYKEYDDMYLEQARSFDYDVRKYWVDMCTKWQYLSGSIITYVYPKICYAYNNETWKDWGDWVAHPGLAMDHFWGEAPLWLKIQYAPDDGDGDDNGAGIESITLIAIVGAVIAAIAAVAVMMMLKKKKAKEMIMEEEEEEELS